jgi:pyruvate dehydrogenase E2 component (dihydrolipoamide acetyltransferase)
VHLLHLPKLGYTMENGAITGWLVPPDTPFEVGAVLYEVETEKNVVQVEARLPGSIAKIVVADDEALAVGELVAVVADPGEDPSEADILEAIRAEHPDFGAKQGSDDADEDADPVSQLAAPVEGPAALASPPNGRVRALPKVRAVADRLGVDLATVTGTGLRGALTVQDVERAAEGAGGDAASVFEGERRALTAVQKAMVAGVSRSWHEVPTFVQQFQVDMTAVIELRTRLKSEGRSVSPTAIFAAAIARAVGAVPEVNATLDGDHLLLHPSVHVGVAVRTERGLVVPTVADVDARDLHDLESTLSTIVEAARGGTLPRGAAATITLSNLAGFGVETGMPLVTAGQAAIVFTGDIMETPTVVDGSVVVRPMMGVAVGYDHRFIDGVTGGEFVRAFRDALGTPDVLLTPARAS